MKKEGFELANIAMTGNGYQLWFSIPTIEITDENRNVIEQKIKNFQKSLIEKYSEDCVKIDN